MHCWFARLALVAATLTVALVGPASMARAEEDRLCQTVTVIGPDGYPRYVTVCVPPEAR